MSYICVKKDNAHEWVEININDATHLKMLDDPRGAGGRGMHILRGALARKYPRSNFSWIELRDYESGPAECFVIIDERAYLKAKNPPRGTTALVKESPLPKSFGDQGNPDCTCDQAGACGLHDAGYLSRQGRTR